MNNLSFTKGGGIVRALPGEDHISGFLYYMTSATYPTGMTSTAWWKILGSPADAITLGITDADASLDIKLLSYHIKEFFRLNPGATLYIGIKTYTSGNNFSEIADFAAVAEGKMRQIAVYNPDNAFATADLGYVETQEQALETACMPAEILYAANIANISSLTTSLHTLTAQDVSVIIGQDGAGAGATLYTGMSTKKSVTCIGASLGTLSKAKVCENIGGLEKFNVANGELDVPAFADGSLVKNTASGTITDLDSKGFIFLYKETGFAGTFHNDSYTAAALTLTWCYIEANRTIKKAIRGVRAALLPKIKGTAKIDPVTGKLDPTVVKALEALGNQPLAQMERDGELSGYQTVIDPDQSLLTTGVLAVSVQNVPLGIIRKMAVNISLVSQLT